MSNSSGLAATSLTLYLHPLASYCWKVLIALYENDTPFRPQLVDLSDPAARAALESLWPFARFPVLRDDARDLIVPESTIIIEYLARHRPGPVALLPAEPDAARDVRLADRFFDLYVHEPMQTIVGDRLRAPGLRDPHGVARARALLDVAYGMIERDMAARRWASGDLFTMADCAAAPALHYADRVHPLGARHPHAVAYLRRLEARPSFARVMAEAAPYAHLFPPE
jgi:glutathione S-transferase